VSRRIFVWLFSAFAFFVMASGGMRDARGQPRAAANDREVESLIESVITSDYLTGNFTQALEQLELAKQACQTQSGCSPKVRARLYIAIGTVLAGGLKKVPEAKEAFAVALKEDPTTGLFGDDFITPEVQKAFNDARAGDTSSGGTQDTKGAAGERKPKKTWPGTGRPPRGWKSAESYFYYEEARISEASRDWLDCVDYSQASLAAENRATTRLLAAACEERAGLWLEAYADYRTVGENGGRNGNTAARERAQALREKIPKLVIRKPVNVENLVVKMNDVEVAPDKIGGEIWLNPGQRTLKATGKVSGKAKEYVAEIDAVEFETKPIDIKFEQDEGTDAKKKALECLLAARTQEELAKCVKLGGAAAPSLTVKASMELAGYHDTDHVDVMSPAWKLGVESPTAGWGVGGSFLIDVVTAASTDIVATASPRWREVRIEPALYAHRKFGSIGDIGIHASSSYSTDDWGKSVGISYSTDVADKRITPAIGFDFGHEDIGRSGTPTKAFNRLLLTGSVGASLSFVLDKATIFSLTFTGILQDGDNSKPYRYIPTFPAQTLKDPKAAQFLGRGALIGDVHYYRGPIRPLEQLPTNLQRYALSGLIAHRFSSSTIRADVRGYTDSWGLKAVTGTLAYFIDLNERLRISPAVHGHYQTQVAFWQRLYSADSTLDMAGKKAVKAPQYRTGDRELGPLYGITGGITGRFAFGEARNWSVTLQGNTVYNYYFDTLYLKERIGFLGVSSLEVDFE
jgi:hypothetical protein